MKKKIIKLLLSENPEDGMVGVTLLQEFSKSFKTDEDWFPYLDTAYKRRSHDYPWMNVLFIIAFSLSENFTIGHSEENIRDNPRWIKWHERWPELDKKIKK